jgi:hypothetical protein
MIIEKNGKTYTVTEHRDKWTVSAESGKLSVAFDVSKELCPTAKRRWIRIVCRRT